MTLAHMLSHELAALVEKRAVRVVFRVIEVESDIDNVDWLIFCGGGARYLQRGGGGGGGEGDVQWNPA